MSPVLFNSYGKQLIEEILEDGDCVSGDVRREKNKLYTWPGGTGNE